MYLKTLPVFLYILLICLPLISSGSSALQCQAGSSGWQCRCCLQEVGSRLMRVSFAHHTKTNSAVRDKQAWTPCGSFYHSSCFFPLLEPVAAAARPLDDILEMLKPLWLQSTNKTVEEWEVKFSALLETLQQHGLFTLMPRPRHCLTRQICSINKNSWIQVLERILVEFLSRPPCSRNGGPRRWLCCGPRPGLL